jgi:hypothetical protein
MVMNFAETAAGRRVPYSQIKASPASAHLAIILPGLSYRATLPVLYYPGRYFAEQGCDRLILEYAYDREPDFASLPDHAIRDRIKNDVDAVFDKVLADHGYREITLIGKSLGTLAMSQQIGRTELASAKMIWLTPVLADPGFIDAMLSGSQPGLAVIGTADPHFAAAEALARLRRSHIKLVELPGADHGLEVKGDVRTPLRALQTMMDAIIDFASFARA